MLNKWFELVAILIKKQLLIAQKRLSPLEYRPQVTQKNLRSSQLFLPDFTARIYEHKSP